MKSVLISIRPKWCEKIASGEKTIEVRKTRPRCETPFKGYIYCTKITDKTKYSDEFDVPINTRKWIGNSKVIGEFICDNIDNHSLSELIVKEDRELALLSTCLTGDEVLEYLGYERGTSIYDCKNFDFYGWHISNLKIYEKPKELSEFHKPCTPECNFSEECGGTAQRNCLFALSRPPQSWCYVKEV